MVGNDPFPLSPGSISPTTATPPPPPHALPAAVPPVVASGNGGGNIASSSSSSSSSGFVPGGFYFSPMTALDGAIELLLEPDSLMRPVVRGNGGLGYVSSTYIHTCLK